MHKLVVIGGGAAGIELVSLLGRIKALVGGTAPKLQVSLMDGLPTHIWKPLLHEVATGALNTGADEVNFFSHSQTNNYKFRLGWMDGLDREKKIIKIAPLRFLDREICGSREVPYDTLVIAVGSVPDTFNIPGVREHSLFLNDFREAEYLRLKILTHGLSVVYGSTPSPVPKLRIGIVGAGATGVELATEIYRTMSALKIHGFEGNQLEISVIEAGPRILPCGSETLSTFALDSLKKMNVDIRTNSVITSVDAKGFVFSNGERLNKEIRIWTAGIKAPDWLKETGLDVTPQNKIKVNSFLQSINDPNVYAIGDCACVPKNLVQRLEHTECLPATAQVAHQQAEWMVNYFKTKFEGGHSHESGHFVYKPQGVIVSLGEYSAVASIASGTNKDIEIKGQLAKGIYNTLYRKHQAVLYGWSRTAILMMGDKLRHVAVPTLKFH